PERVAYCSLHLFRVYVIWGESGVNRARLSEGLIVTLHHPAIVQALKPNKHSIPAIKDKDEAFSCKNMWF
ncbi:MAG: hypothetical protein ACP5N5_06265, partial [Desulfurococcus sp.]|uniref:hypothetical protein n=1 Tax=Desulfurococcus sp. TaxID=51678 RepID=UPI003D0B9FB4